jgi:hypothetical protein
MYEVQLDYFLQEQAIQLNAGIVFDDSDLEPDVIGDLLDKGVIVDLNAPEPEPLPVEDAPEDVS